VAAVEFSGLAQYFTACRRVYLLTLPFAVWVLTTFSRSCRTDIEEAALVDGCTRWQALDSSFCRCGAGTFYRGDSAFYMLERVFFALIILT